MATACGCKTCMHIEFIVYAIIFHYSFLLFFGNISCGVSWLHSHYISEYPCQDFWVCVRLKVVPFKVNKVQNQQSNPIVFLLE